MVAVGLAIAAMKNSPSTRTILVDLGGDIPAILGMDEPSIGLSEWISQPSMHDFDDVLIEAAPGLSVLARGRALLPESRSGAWSRAILELSSRCAQGSMIVVDAGREPIAHDWKPHVTRTLLIVRPCYLALRRARLAESSFDGVVAVTEPDRVLTVADIGSVLGVDVVAHVPMTGDIARRIDAGVTLTRPPKQLIDVLTPLVDRSCRP